MIWIACAVAFVAGALIGNHFSQGLFWRKAKEFYAETEDRIRG